ncbi:hypothetical protein MHBO_001867 [Bonamia ostreae]|uniref:Uncharacterized protein n=1 Tax=Bonamia ostreae TaxID=126728 RepID=A0ABV2AKG6_9EUKA
MLSKPKHVINFATKRFFVIFKSPPRNTSLNFKDKDLKQMVKALPEKYFDKNKHPKGILHNRFSRFLAVKSMANKNGKPAPLFSDIPGQRPGDLVMKHILESKSPQNRNELWRSLSPKKFLVSKRHLSKVLHSLIARQILIVFQQEPKKPFVYTFNTEKKKIWNDYVAKTVKEREVFLQLFAESAKTKKAISELRAEREKRHLSKINSQNDQTIKKDLRRKQVLQGEGRNEKEKMENLEWKNIIWSGSGFVDKRERAEGIGCVYYERKKLVNDLLGITGPHPRKRRRALKFIEKKKEDFKRANEEIGREL